MPERRTAVVTARVSAAESADWRAKAKAAGVPLSALIRRAMARTRTWTARAAEVERERTRQVSRIGNNLNQIAKWGEYPQGGGRGRRGPRPLGLPSSARSSRWLASRIRSAMHVKFLAHGTGSAGKAASYLLGGAGRRREAA